MEPKGRTPFGQVLAALRWPFVAPVYHLVFKMTPRFWPYVKGVNPEAKP